jgi:hypothetical protein
MSGKKIGDSHRVFGMRTHPPGNGAHAAQDQPAIERRGDRSTLVLNTADTLEKIILHFGNNNSPEYITVTAEIFCRGMQD